MYMISRRPDKWEAKTDDIEHDRPSAGQDSGGAVPNIPRHLRRITVVAGFPCDSHRCDVTDGLDTGFRVAGIEYEVMYTNSRRTSTVKVRCTTAAQAQAALACCRADPDVLLVSWSGARMQLRMKLERSSAEVVVAAPMLREAWWLRAQGD